MSLDKEKLYQLIPAVYRIKDEEIAVANRTEKGPLRAFIELFAEQIELLDADLDQLYNDQFIETCADWVVPYIGDLVGARDLISIPDASVSERAQVANTLTYRRRKGTLSVIEQLAQDITGWPSHAVEYFHKLATTQYMNHIRPGNKAIASIKNALNREAAKTPFNSYNHTLEVRSIASGRGKYNIPNIGIFLWRILSMPATHSRAYKIDSTRFTFDCAGKDTPLYNYPLREDEVSHISDSDNVPTPISRLKMHRHPELYYGKSDKSIWLYDIPLEDISICNLRDDENGDWINIPVDRVTIDPQSGRIAFPADSAPEKLYVNYYYGSPGLIGAGEYQKDNLTVTDADTKLLKVPEDLPTIQAAINKLKNTGGIIELTQNDYYIETPSIQIKEGKTIEIRAEDGVRPIVVLSENLNIYGGVHSSFILNGLFVIGGCICVPLNTTTHTANYLNSLIISNCTLMPGASPAIESVPAQPSSPKIIVETSATVVTLSNTISGSLQIDKNANCNLANCIVDAGAENNQAYKGMKDFGGALTVKNSTIIGTVEAVAIPLASNSLFLASDNTNPPMIVKKSQEGCIRFSYVPPGSVLPKKHKCQPSNENDVDRTKPIFNSLQFGRPDYGQLNPYCPKEILEGADNGSEMGAFNNLYQQQKISSLKNKLNEYLPFGLEAGIFFGS